MSGRRRPEWTVRSSGGTPRQRTWHTRRDWCSGSVCCSLPYNTACAIRVFGTNTNGGSPARQSGVRENSEEDYRAL
jgi:hypothetical protein